jgi:threonine/homoserine/homoserine lactone efflux protein
MPPIESILAVTLAGLVLSITPGPSMLYVVSRSIGQSRAAGLASALGLGLGGVVLAIATALGLAALFATFEWITPALRWAGSIYLVYLGIGMIRDARATAHFDFSVEKIRETPLPKIVMQGVLIEVLNPKTVLFFTLFLPPFIELSADGGEVANVQLQFLLLGVLVPLTAIPSDLLVAFFAGSATRVINRNQAGREWLAYFGGITLIAIAANLHLGFI